MEGNPQLLTTVNENLCVMVLDLRYNKLDGEGRGRGRQITNGEGEAAKAKSTASSEVNHKGKKRSERICKKNRDTIHPYEKESRKCEAYRFFIAYKMEKDQKLMFGGGAQYSS